MSHDLALLLFGYVHSIKNSTGDLLQQQYTVRTWRKIKYIVYLTGVVIRDISWATIGKQIYELDQEKLLRKNFPMMSPPKLDILNRLLLLLLLLTLFRSIFLHNRHSWSVRISAFRPSISDLSPWMIPRFCSFLLTSSACSWRFSSISLMTSNLHCASLFSHSEYPLILNSWRGESISSHTLSVGSVRLLYEDFFSRSQSEFSGSSTIDSGSELSITLGSSHIPEVIILLVLDLNWSWLSAKEE